MEFETKILSKGIQEMLYNSDKTVGTAESCTGGRIAEALISVPGASNYFKGGVVSYTNEVKENLLGVSHELLEEKTAFCEEVAKEMVLGAIKALNVDFAISTSNSGRAEAHAVQLRKLQRYWVFRLVRFMLPVLTIRIITKQYGGRLNRPSFYGGVQWHRTRRTGTN